MALLPPFILGLVQGLTEFLPVSSSGHLVIAAQLLDYQSPGLLMEMAVHTATTLAVIVYFRRRFASVFFGVFNDGESRKLVLMLAVSFCATALVGVGLDQIGLVHVAFDSPVFVGFMLLATAGALISVIRLHPTQDTSQRLQISWKVALLVGLVQGFAILPGISRSGFTIVAGIWGGMGRRSAAEFSFLLSVPTILAASLFQLVREPEVTVGDGWALVIAGAVAFIAGLAAIHWVMRWLQRGRLWWFAVYCALVGAGSLVFWGIF